MYKKIRLTGIVIATSELGKTDCFTVIAQAIENRERTLYLGSFAFSGVPGLCRTLFNYMVHRASLDPLNRFAPMQLSTQHPPPPLRRPISCLLPATEIRIGLY